MRVLHPGPSLLLILSLLPGCGSYLVRERTVRHADLVDPAASRVTGYLSDSSGNIDESVPSSISVAVVADDANLERVTPAETCVRIIMRSRVDRDQPLTVYRTSLNGQAATATEVRVGYHDYAYGTSQEVASVEMVEPDRVTEVHLLAPTEATLRVIEREGTWCAPLVSPTRIRLDVRLPDRMSTQDPGFTFIWTLVSPKLVMASAAEAHYRASETSRARG